MQRQHHLTVLLILAALSAASPAAAHPEDKAINATYAALAAARTTHDVAGMASHFHPQGLLIDARPGPALPGAELAARLAPQAERLVKDGVSITSAYRVEKRQILDGGLALDAGYMRQALKRDGAPEQVRYSRFLVTMKREKSGAWKIVGDAAMPSTAEVWNALTPQTGLTFDS
jgi:ketosteroid isomerase-like protein